MKEKIKRFLSIDLGIKNPVTMVDSADGTCLILGRDYNGKNYYFDKKIRDLKQVYKSEGLENVKTKKLERLIKKKINSLEDILHKVTRFITDYCKVNKVNCVIVGKITESPDEYFPYGKFYKQLSEKLKKVGIVTVQFDEAYSSQCAPGAEEVSKKFAEKSKRIHRGLFVDGSNTYNADGLGAFNILKSFLKKYGLKQEIPVEGIKSPKVINVSV